MVEPRVLPPHRVELPRRKPPAGTGTTPAPTAPTTPTGPASSEDVSKALAEVNAAMDALKSAQQTGDFSGYGAALDRLQKAVDAYQALPPS